MTPKLNTTQIGMVLVLVPITFEIVFILLLAGLLASQEQTLDTLSHSRDAILAVQKAATTVPSAIATVTCMDSFTAENHKELDEAYEIVKHPQETSKHVAAFPEIKSIFEDLDYSSASVVGFVTALKQISDDKSLTENQQLWRLNDTFGENQGLFLQMCMDAGTAMKRIPPIESRVRAAQPEEMNRFHWQLGLLLIGGLGMSAGISIKLANIFSKDIVNRLKKIGQSAQLLAAGKPLSKPTGPADEFTRVEQVLYESNLLLMERRGKERAIIDHAADVLCSLDSRLRIEAVSASSIKVWKYSPDELLGMSILSLLTADTSEDTRLAFQEIAKSKYESRVENVVRCKNRELKNSLWTVNWSDEHKQFYCVVHDITELRTIERLKQHFLSMVSHDLRTPLSSVAVSFELLTDGKRGPVSAPVLEELASCRSSLDVLTRLVNELLELEKWEARMFKIEEDYVSASDICRVAGDAVEALAVRRNVSLKLPTNDLIITGDENRLVSVFTKLFSCAIAASPFGGTVVVKAQRIGKFVEIKVADQGPGMSERDCRLIFEKFGQTLLTDSPYKEFGFGIVISKEIIFAHGGECGVISEPGKGCEFVVKIPAFDSEQTEDEI